MQDLREKAKQGLQLIRDAIIEYLSRSGDWVAHGKIQDDLDIRLPLQGHHTGYLSHSILNVLEKEGRVERDGRGRGKESRFRIIKKSK